MIFLFLYLATYLVTKTNGIVFIVGTCFDGAMNQDENDVDCNGVCRGQYSCHLLGLCSDNSDCKSGWCVLNTCRSK